MLIYVHHFRVLLVVEFGRVYIRSSKVSKFRGFIPSSMGNKRKNSGRSPKIGRRKSANATSSTIVSADISASTSGQPAKKVREDDEASLLSANRFSVLSEAGTAVNVSDLNGFGQVQEEENSPLVTNKLPPLVVKSLQLEKLQRAFQAININAQYKLTRIGIKVMMQTNDEFEKAKTYLKNVEAQFFTHDLPSIKPFKAVVRGLPVMDPEDIKTELEGRYKLQPLNVYVIARKQIVNRDYRDRLYLVHFRKGTVTLGALKAMKVINNVIVSWEPYRGIHKDVTQCMRCLHFGHGTRNCHLKPRCNICASNHETSKCPMEGAADQQQQIKCANCGEPHCASDRSCKVREEYKQIRKEASTKNHPGRRPNYKPAFTSSDFPALPQPSMSARNNPPPGFQSSSNTAPIWTRSREEPSSIPVENAAPKYTAAELLPIFTTMWTQLQQCSTRADQIRVLGEFIISYGQ